MLTVYAKYRPTEDELIRKYYPKSQRKDVCIFDNPKDKKPWVVFYWYQRKPNKRSKKITLNCFTYKLRWL